MTTLILPNESKAGFLYPLIKVLRNLEVIEMDRAVGAYVDPTSKHKTYMNYPLLKRTNGYEANCLVIRIL